MASSDTFHFDGFDGPNGTIIPDVFFDYLAPHLTEGELRVLLYIMRRTFGFKKTSDDISLSQMVSGITKHDGEVLDLGAGIQRAAASRAVKGLKEKGIVQATRRYSQERGNETTTYRLRFKGPIDPKDQGASLPKIPGGSFRKIPALVSQRYPQETVVQQTVDTSSNTSKVSLAVAELQGSVLQGEPETGPHTVGDVLAKERRTGRRRSSPTPQLDAVISDYSEQFGDQQHLRSNLSRARNLMDEYAVPEEVMAEICHQSAAITRDRRTTTRKPMAYLFELIEERAERYEEAHKPRSLAGRYAHLVER